jgi:plasmid stability protein
VSTLHVRNVPEDVYERLRELAEERGTSISAEAIRLLERALQTDTVAVRKLLDEIDRHRPKARAGTPPAAELIREERERRGWPPARA